MKNETKVTITMDSLTQALFRLENEKLIPSESLIECVNEIVKIMAIRNYNFERDPIITYRDGLLFGVLLGRCLDVQSIEIRIHEKKNEGLGCL